MINKKEAELCLWYVRKWIYEKAELIGSFGKGAETSTHDIDIHVQRKIGETRDKVRMKKLLDADSVEDTDWGGWYFHNTPFGDVDIFFDTSKFDY